MANVVVGVIVAAGWIYSIKTANPTIGSGKVSSGELLNEFQKIPAPLDVLATDGLVQKAKSSSILIERRYTARSYSFDMIFKYYDQELKENNWSYLGRYADGSNGGERYCKGFYQANLEFMPKIMEVTSHTYFRCIGTTFPSLSV